MTNTLYFTKFHSEDDFSYYRELVSNEKLMEMNYGRVFTMEETQYLFGRILERNQKHSCFGDFKVFEASTHHFIGMGTVVVNDDCSEAEIEYVLLPNYWDQGYGSRIAKEMLNKVEEMESIQKVTAITSPNNAVSRKILLKKGFQSQEINEIEDGSLAEMFVKEVHKV